MDEFEWQMTVRGMLADIPSGDSSGVGAGTREDTEVADAPPPIQAANKERMLHGHTSLDAREPSISCVPPIRICVEDFQGLHVGLGAVIDLTPI